MKPASQEPKPIEKAKEELVRHPIVRAVTELFTSAGCQLYLVGGSVRDALIGREHFDFDFATDATPEQTVALARGFADNLWQVGMRFGTVGIEKAGAKIEITTFRREVYPADSRHPEVTFSRDIDTDLSRRDFTINAMAIRLPDGEFVDPFAGLSDLLSGHIRTPLSPEQSFLDDPLRMVRALRFAATLDMTPTADVLQAVHELRERLRIVSRERVREELSKLLVAPRAGFGLWLLVQTHLAEHMIPELIELAQLRDPAHRHKDVLKHTLTVVERTEPDLALRLAALFHDIGKPQTRSFDGEVHFYHHEIVSARIAAARLRELRYPVKLIEEVTTLISFHMRFHTYRLGWSDAAVRRYVREVGPVMPRLNNLVRADCTTQNPFLARKYGRLQDELEARIGELEAQEESAKMRPPLDGNEVMEFLDVPPGPEVGKVLKLLLEARLEGKIRTKKEARDFLTQWKNSGESNV